MRLLFAAVICATAVSALSAWQIQAWRHSADLARIETAQAEALKSAIEQERQNHDRLAKAAQSAHKRAQVAHADAAAARDELDRLRLDIARSGEPETTAAAADLRADLFGDLLGQCAREYLSMAQKADRADIAARALIEAWPK